MYLSEALRHPWLTVRVQIALGAIFVAAALPKILDPPAFAHQVYNYRMLPGAAVNALAMLLPWIELLAGLALILGVWRRQAAVTAGVLLLVFIGAIGFNLARGHAVDCGCFEVRPVPKTRDQLLADMRWVLVRDFGMLLLVAQVITASRVNSRAALGRVYRGSGTPATR